MQMSEMFCKMQDIVQDQLSNIISENKRRQEADKEQGIYEPSEAYNLAEDFNNNNNDLINDVGTEEFISKNIRVRPASGMTTGDRDDKQSDVYGGKQQLMDMGQSMMDEEEKFNQNVNYEMNIARVEVKKAKQNYEEAVIKQAEKAAKLKNNKK